MIYESGVGEDRVGVPPTANPSGIHHSPLIIFHLPAPAVAAPAVVVAVPIMAMGSLPALTSLSFSSLPLASLALLTFTSGSLFALSTLAPFAAVSISIPIAVAMVVSIPFRAVIPVVVVTPILGAGRTGYAGSNDDGQKDGKFSNRHAVFLLAETCGSL